MVADHNKAVGVLKSPAYRMVVDLIKMPYFESFCFQVPQKKPEDQQWDSGYLIVYSMIIRNGRGYSQ